MRHLFAIRQFTLAVRHLRSLCITEKAANKLKEVAKSGEHLRILVDSGGCSGFEYKLSLEKELHDEDEIIEKDGAMIVVDKMSLDFVKGATLDYTEDLMRSSFRITDNPLATQGCSCGSSFAPKNFP
jgi:iron-sulfur cluster assembly accessory protein